MSLGCGGILFLALAGGVDIGVKISLRQWMSASADDTFTTWAMFMPPGANSVYVPIENWLWNYGSNQDAEYNTSTSIWDDPIGYYNCSAPQNAIGYFPSWYGVAMMGQLTLRPATN